MSLVFVAGIMVYFGVKQALFVGQYQKTVYLQISLFYLYLSVPVGGVLIFLKYPITKQVHRDLLRKIAEKRTQEPH